MTPKQKLIVGILAVANIAVILTLAALVTRPTAPSTSPHPHTSTPSHLYTHVPSYSPSPPHPPSDCQWRATQLLAQAGLGGTLTMTADSLLDFVITYPLAPDQTTDEAAEAVWTAFDVALALYEDGCTTFTRIEVAILVHGSHADTQIDATVSTTDLMAYNAGELGEEDFIERVTYTVHSMDQPQ